MIEWQESTLGDLITLQRGHDLAKTEMKPGSIPVAGSNGIIGYHNKATTKAIGITIGRSGNIGNAYLYKEDFWAHNTTLYVKDFKGNDEIFVFYLLKSIDFSGFNVGSAVPTLNRNHIHPMVIQNPAPEEQKAIASVLRSLDDKIDLLHRQNTTLEAMAETLFRQWFVEEAREDWKFVELGEYLDCYNGVSYKSSELNPSKVAMVTLKSFDRNGGFRLDGFKEFTGRFKEQHVVVQGDLVVAHTDITQGAEVIGNPVLVVNDTRYEHMVISMDLVKVKSKHEWLSNEFLYRMMRTREFKEHCLGYSNGSTVLHLSKQAIPSFEFFMPPKEKIQSYTEFAKDLFGKKFKNIEQILTLEKLRDNLLPKLMSGEVRL